MHVPTEKSGPLVYFYVAEAPTSSIPRFVVIPDLSIQPGN